MGSVHGKVIREVEFRTHMYRKHIRVYYVFRLSFKI